MDQVSWSKRILFYKGKGKHFIKVYRYRCRSYYIMLLMILEFRSEGFWRDQIALYESIASTYRTMAMKTTRYGITLSPSSISTVQRYLMSHKGRKKQNSPPHHGLKKHIADKDGDHRETNNFQLMQSLSCRRLHCGVGGRAGERLIRSDKPCGQGFVLLWTF